MTDADEQMRDPELTDVEREAAAEEPQQDSTEYVEFTGVGDYGTEFYGDTGHTISRRDAKNGWDEEIPSDLVWRRGKGKLAKRYLLPLSEVPENVRELVLGEPHFKKVTLQN